MEDKRYSLDQELGLLSATPIELNGDSPTSNVTRRRIDVLKELKCPCCFELIFPPVKDCCNGHHVCVYCLEKITSCPVCREPAGITQNRFAEEFLEKYIIRCCNHELGCQKYFWVEELAKKEAHESGCKCRMLQCWIPNCRNQSMFPILVNHWENTHRIKQSESDEGSFKFTMYKGPAAYLSTAMHLTCHGHSFLAIIQAFPGQTSICVYGYYHAGASDDDHQRISYESHISLTVNGRIEGEEKPQEEETVHWIGKVRKETDSPQSIENEQGDCFVKLPEQYENTFDEIHCIVKVAIIPRPITA